jgi:hypothetical protein
VDEQLVLVTGLAASGKTTIPKFLASRARSIGITAAALDMDDSLFVINGPDCRSVDVPGVVNLWRATRIRD